MLNNAALSVYYTMNFVVIFVVAAAVADDGNCVLLTMLLDLP